MTNADCLALLMGDDPPQEIENSLYYRFLTSLFKRRPDIPAAHREEASRGLVYVLSFRIFLPSLFINF